MKKIISIFCLLIFCIDAQEPTQNSIAKSLTDFAIGGTSGACAMYAYAPWNYFQNRRIQKLPIEWKNPIRWFKGAPCIAIGKAPVIAVQTASYEWISRIMKKNSDNKPLSNAQQIAAAMVAGGLSAPVGNITQLVALHQQNNKTTFYQTINQFPEKYKSLTRASFASIYREIIFTNVFMNLLPLIKKNIDKNINNKIISQTASATLCGAVVAFCAQPLQVIVVTLHADIEKKEYRGMIDAARKIAAFGGIKGFYKGSGYRSVGVIFALPVLSFVQDGLYKINWTTN